MNIFEIRSEDDYVRAEGWIRRTVRGMAHANIPRPAMAYPCTVEFVSKRVSQYFMAHLVISMPLWGEAAQ